MVPGLRRRALRVFASALCTAALTLAACSGGGGGGGGSHVVAGRAAAGRPVSGGRAFLLDAAGRSSGADVSSDGGYRIDVSDLQAPFLVEVVGTVGGNPAILHSAATATDVNQGRTVNVTPLTELATAFALRGSPGAVFRDASRTLAPLTDDALSSAGGEVRAALAPLLRAFGADVDPRITPFAADGTGMDGALDALKLLPVQDAATGAARYELSLVTASGTVMLDPAAPPGGAVVSFSSADLARLQAVLAALPAIDAQLQALAAKLATSIPAAGEVSSSSPPGSGTTASGSTTTCPRSFSLRGAWGSR